MKALFWIFLCAGVYFLLRLFDPDGKKVHEQSKPEPKPEPSPQPKPAPQPRVVHDPNAPVQALKFFCVKDKGYHVSVWPKDQRIGEYVEFSIAGITHYADTAMKHLGESLAILAEEPDNPYDPDAIRIMTSDWQLLGYVPRDMTAEVRRYATLSCPCFIYIGYRPDEGTFFTDAYIKCSLSNS